MRINTKKIFYLFVSIMLIGNACTTNTPANSSLNLENTTGEEVKDNKIIIYQMMVRLFGNKNTTNKLYGLKEENGTGKFYDVTEEALEELKKLGVTHVWYTGVLEHATMTDYTAYGITLDDPDVVKGRAGSPYAVKDYYDVDPDLAVDVQNRMAEFEALVARTHKNSLKVIIDFIPNHVARTYVSDAKPAGVRGFGEEDDTTKAFDPKNDFYYLPGSSFIVPAGVNPGGNSFQHPLKDGKFEENPPKVTGNNVFSAEPSIDDWYETIKLNYGVDYQNGKKAYFEPVPPVWIKMRDILRFWASKNVDGFRCDVAEMVPVEFWNWVIPQVKEVKPDLIFIAEAYDPKVYQEYLTIGKFDFLYDKVGLYDGLKRLIKNEPDATVEDITDVWSKESRGFSSQMLRFLENHDEERIASAGFAQDPWIAKPAMVLTATLASGPVMIYFGQEVGEPGKGVEGFSKEDNRTTIFDYWGVPEHQKWMNNGRFDGGKLSENQKKLRSFYQTLLNFSAQNNAIRVGQFYELNNQPGLNQKQYAYLRYAGKERVLMVANFDRNQTLETNISIPQDVKNAIGLTGSKAISFKNELTQETYQVKNVADTIPIKVGPSDAVILSF